MTCSIPWLTSTSDQSMACRLFRALSAVWPDGGCSNDAFNAPQSDTSAAAVQCDVSETVTDSQDRGFSASRFAGTVEAWTTNWHLQHRPAAISGRGLCWGSS